MFDNIQKLQPRAGGGGGALSVEDKAKLMLDDIMDKLPEGYDMIEIMDKVAGTVCLRIIRNLNTMHD